MRSSIILLAAALGGVIPMEDGAYLKPLYPRDSVLIADQVEYGVRLDGVAAGTSFALPHWPDSLVAPLELLSDWRVDTVRTARKQQLYDLSVSRVVTTFDEGLYRLPPIAVERRLPDGTVDTLVFAPPVLDVKTLPVDTATFVIHDIKGQVCYPLTFREVLPWLAGIWLAAALIILAVCLYRTRRRKEGGMAAPAEPAHITALRKLDRYRGNRYWGPDRQKQFYSGVTDALREYIVARYGVAAMEMTTAEIFDGLRQGGDVPPELYDEMKALFERADFVKFAKYIATPEENASVLPDAVRFVTSTYQTGIGPETEG